MTTFETRTPVDGSVYVTREYASDLGIIRALDAAKEVLPQWQGMRLEERQAMCQHFLGEFAKEEARITEQLCWQMGRPVRFGASEVRGFIDRASTMIDLAPQALERIRLPEKSGFIRYVDRVPLGISLVVAPWNYPYLTAVNTLIPALLSGNVVLLKHSQQTPLCAELLEEVALRAGLPAGVLQCLHLDHAQVGKLVAHADIAHVAFTGSVAGGRAMEQHAAGHFKAVGLELGGKDPAYVRPDADLKHAAATVIDGAMFNSGQSCCGIERAYVHADVYDQFVAEAVQLANAYTLGRPDDPETTLGPMISSSAANIVRAQIEEACQLGAEKLIAEERFVMSQPETAYLGPQLLVNVDHRMRVMTEESFGPVLGIQRVKNDEEAVRWMNDSEYGLTAAIFTRDMGRAESLGNQLETGTVFANRCDYLDAGLAWTGVKQSGRGCTLSRVGFEHLTRPKSFHLKESP